MKSFNINNLIGIIVIGVLAYVVYKMNEPLPKYVIPSGPFKPRNEIVKSIPKEEGGFKYLSIKNESDYDLIVDVIQSLPKEGNVHGPADFKVDKSKKSSRMVKVGRSVSYRVLDDKSFENILVLFCYKKVSSSEVKKFKLSLDKDHDYYYAASIIKIWGYDIPQTKSISRVTNYVIKRKMIHLAKKLDASEFEDEDYLFDSNETEDQAD